MNLQRNELEAAKGRLGLGMVKWGMVLAASLFVIFLGFTDKANAMGNADSAAVRYLGPHGNGIGCAVIGIAMALLSVWRLSVIMAKVKAIKAQQAAGL